MRIGLISDIHSNLEALTQSLAALERTRPDRVICLGDVVGYGASVNECCDLVRKVAERVKRAQGWGAWPSCSRRIGLR